MAIPRKIHYCWFGNGQKTELVEKCIASWKKFCPDYEIIEWNEYNYDVTQNEYMHQAYQAKRWGFVSDYARLDIVYRYGGIYLDTDVELVKSMDTLLDGDGFIGFELPVDREGLHYTVNTGQGFGAPAGSLAIQKMLDEYRQLSFLNSDGSQNLTACPAYNTRALQALGLKLDNSLQDLDGFCVYPTDYFCPINWKTKKCVTTVNTYSIHHFDASWLTVSEKRRRKFARHMDFLIHLPNLCVRTLLGTENYEKLKAKLGR